MLTMEKEMEMERRWRTDDFDCIHTGEEGRRRWRGIRAG